MTTGVGAVADVVGVNEGWALLAVLKGVRGGEELEKLFPWVGPFFEFFLGEFRVILELTPPGVPGVVGVPGVPGELGGIDELGDRGT